MTNTDRVEELLSIYFAASDGGTPMPEELCRDCPELLGELRSRIRVLELKAEQFGQETTRDFSRSPIVETDAYLPAAPEESGAPRLERYEVLAELGRGGMGVVYKARDTRTGRVVALKTMKLHSGRALELFKGEFRYLQGVSHPNLVQLYALESDKGRWLLTMEFVEGENFRDFLRPRTGPSQVVESSKPVKTTLPTEEYHLNDSVSNAADIPVLAPSAPYDLGRLMDCFGQLAEGIEALHSHRRVHRDLKPQNVRVGSGGRVVVLDFGLTAALDYSREYLASALMGTPAYMAPEQGGFPPVATPASDWYAFGVMLYEVVTGVLPFQGKTILELLAQKRNTIPPRPRELSPGASRELDDLCMALLSPRPELRPTGEEILRTFGKGSAPILNLARRLEDAPILGRNRQLDALKKAYAKCIEGESVVVKVTGPSGIGKSRLVEHFTRGLRDEGTVVLSGRCYEHESVPYKALDPLVDELARYLHGRPDEEVSALVPNEIGALVRVFPVLERVEAINRRATGARLSPDPLELREQAFVELRKLLRRLAHTVRLVLSIDDLQWGDVDSAYLISDLVQPPDPPRVLWLLSQRSEDVESPCLRTLTESLHRAGPTDVREVEVAPLTEAETIALVGELLGTSAPKVASEIARESGGNPFFITELVQWISAQSGSDRNAPTQERVTMDWLIRSRVSRLPTGARHLLELVAVSGRPLRDLDAYQAVGAEDDAQTLMARLEAGRFLRGIGSADEIRLETYHDRIREAVMAGLGKETRRGHHQRLADVLEQSGRGELEELAQHFEGAGENKKAGSYYERAADKATRSLAFDQAVGFYQKAVALPHRTDPVAQPLRLKLAEALSNGGRLTEAGQSFMTAAESAPEQQRELQIRAAKCYMLGGFTNEGLEIVRAQLDQLGLPFPNNQWSALWGMLVEKVRLRFRGLKLAERPLDTISSKALAEIDACNLGHGLMFVAPVASQLYLLRGTRLALDAGEPNRMVFFLAASAASIAMESSPSATLPGQMLQLATSLNSRISDPNSEIKTVVSAGAVKWAHAFWGEALALCGRVAQTALSRQSSYAEHSTVTEHLICDCLMMMGRWRELNRVVGRALHEGQRRSDRFATSTMLVHSYVPHLAAGRLQDAENAIREAWEQWPVKGNVMGGYWSLYGRVEVLLYRGQGANALALIRREMAELGRHTFYQFMVILNTLMNHLIARASLRAAADTRPGGFFSPRARHLRVMGRYTRKVCKARLRCSEPLATLLRAGVANLNGPQEESLNLLVQAEQELRSVEMDLYAIVARRQRGRLMGGEEGQSLIQEADAWMREQDIVEPARIAAMLAPGFPD